PGTVQPGREITGLERAAQLPGKVFHAGTELSAGRIVTNGGRVLCAVGLGDGVAQAQRAAYALVDCLSFRGAQYRHDIGHRAIARDS
ncbi:MAG TPA: phosphoribosylglycinamide synthetase C domain-containing protein, partial [Burkholderiaceae bacterium]|nr:phosphoribosylglycinamide synthetase C domain-containing protein [Burkholderiaceae bacterium]